MRRRLFSAPVLDAAESDQQTGMVASSPGVLLALVRLVWSRPDLN